MNHSYYFFLSAIVLLHKQFGIFRNFKPPHLEARFTFVKLNKSVRINYCFYGEQWFSSLKSRCDRKERNFWKVNNRKCARFWARFGAKARQVAGGARTTQIVYICLLVVLYTATYIYLYTSLVWNLPCDFNLAESSHSNNYQLFYEIKLFIPKNCSQRVSAKNQNSYLAWGNRMSFVNFFMLREKSWELAAFVNHVFKSAIFFLPMIVAYKNVIKPEFDY